MMKQKSKIIFIILLCFIAYILYTKIQYIYYTKIIDISPYLKLESIKILQDHEGKVVRLRIKNISDVGVRFGRDWDAYKYTKAYPEVVLFFESKIRPIIIIPVGDWQQSFYLNPNESVDIYFDLNNSALVDNKYIDKLTKGSFWFNYFRVNERTYYGKKVLECVIESPAIIDSTPVQMDNSSHAIQSSQNPAPPTPTSTPHPTPSPTISGCGESNI